MRKVSCSLLGLFFILSTFICCAQQKDSSESLQSQSDISLKEVNSLPSGYYSKVDKRITLVNDEVTKKSLKYLAKFQRKEKRIQERLQTLNPDVVISKADQKYNALTREIKNKTAGVTRILTGVYVPNIDSLGNSLAFLKVNSRAKTHQLSDIWF